MQTEKSQSFKDLCESLNVDFTKVNEVASFEQACEILAIDTKVPDVSMLPEYYHKPTIAQYKLMIIAEALNKVNGENWKPDWTNYSEYKYYPWFDKASSGGGFSFHGSDFWCTYSIVGSRLCYINRDTARFAGKHFIDLYNDLFDK